MTAGIKANVDGSAAIQVGGSDVITLTSGGAATFLTSPTTVQAGTAAAPSITFSGDTNTGIYSPGADQVAIATGGTAAIYANSSQNVGIGTTSPASKLHVTGLMRICDPAAYLLFRNAADTTSNGVIQFPDSGAATIQQYRNEALYFATNNTERMRIDASGNVGINDPSPSTKGLFSVRLSEGRHFAVGSNAQPVARYDDNGVPTFQFQNYGITAANQGYQIAWSFGDAIANAGTAGVIRVATEQAWTSTASTRDAYMAFSTGLDGTATERARITSDGYSRFADNGTYSYTGTAHTINNSASNDIVRFFNSNATPYGIFVKYTAADPNNTTSYVFAAEQNTGVNIYKIWSNGTVTARSDAKWKKNIETARDGYAEDLAKLRVVKYNWYNHDDGTPKELGLIAQEVEQVFPGLVTTDEQTRNEIKTREIPAVLDEEGNEVEPARTEEYTEKVGTGEYSKSIKFSVLPIMLLKAIQEQQAMIDELKAEVAALKGI